MAEVFFVLAALSTTMAMVPAVAHALEWPGKRRLDREEYRTVQRIYYPGFTIAGVAEVPSIILTAVALGFSQPGSLDLVLRTVALVGLIAVHGVYWVRVHPVNAFWVEGEDLSKLGAGFFAVRTRSGNTRRGSVTWTGLRDRWEAGHLARAVLAVVSVAALIVALG